MLWSIVAIGTVIAVGFLLALQSQLNIYQLGRKDADLKAEFHEMANRQRVETLRQQQALHDVEVGMLTQQSSLLQPKLVRVSPAKSAAESRSSAAGRVVKVVKTRKVPSSPRDRRGGR